MRKEILPKYILSSGHTFLNSSWKPTPSISHVSGGVQSQACFASPGQWGICRAGVLHFNLAAREFFPISTFTLMKEIKVFILFILWWVHFWKPLAFEEFPFLLSMTPLGRICREQDPGNIYPHFLVPPWPSAHHLWKAQTTLKLIFHCGTTSSGGSLDPGLTVPKGLLDTPEPLWAFRYLI